MKGTTKAVIWLAGLGLIALLLAAVLCVRSFLGYSRAEGGAPGGSAISVFIQNPQPASKFEEKSLVVIDARASGPASVLALELWIDGKLAGVRSAPSAQGYSPFHSNFTWDAMPIGPHEAFVRAIDTSGGASSSPVLPFEVVAPGTIAPEELSGAYADPGTSIPVSQGGGGGGGGAGGGNAYEPVEPPQVLPPDAPTEAKPWSPTLGGWIGYVFATSLPPAAPSIPASAIEVCAPRIWISDNSENEQGFYVYRRDPGMADFVKINTLAAHVGVIFTFDDGDLFGNYQYYVSAFNEGGEAPSNVVNVGVASANCTEPAVTVKLTTLLSKTSLEKGYCYMSFDGANWSRYPANPEEFLPPSDDGFGLQGVGDLAALANSGKSVALDLECWGWAGGSLEMIGKWHWDNVLQPGIQHDGLDIETYGGGGNILQVDGHLPIHLLYDTRVPIPIVSLGSGAQGCADHVGGNFILALVCADIADDLDYAVWTLGECPADLCFKESDVIGYNIYDSLHDGGHSPAHTADSPIQIYFMINDTSCDPRDIRVTALVEDGGVVHESFPSNTVHYSGNPNCPFLFGLEQRQYQVVLDTITFTAINDDPDIQDDAEGKGWVIVQADSHLGPSWTLSAYPYVPEFNDDPPGNAFLWALIPLCNGTGYPTYCTVQNLDDLFNKNGDLLYLSSNEGATIHVELYDMDDTSEDDPICIPADYYFNQASVDSAPDHILHISMSASHDSGSCQVEIKIQGY